MAGNQLIRHERFGARANGATEFGPEGMMLRDISCPSYDD